MSTEENKAKVRRIIEEVWNGGNLAVLDELVAANCVFHDPSTTLSGPEGIKRYVMYRMAFPDVHFTIDDLIAEGERVVIRWAVIGNHKGKHQGFAQSSTCHIITNLNKDDTSA